MKFRILDLFLITTFIAGLFGAYANDLIIFRQLLFLACTTVFATLGCTWLSKHRLPTVNSAIAGGLGGIVFTTITLLSPLSFYTYSSRDFLTSSQLDTLRKLPFFELPLAPFLAMILGSAIGPLFYGHLKGNTSSTNQKQQMLSWCFLCAACLLMLFSMMDRLNFGASTRNWLYGVPLLLIIFVFHTISWVHNEYRERIVNDNAITGEPPSD